MSPSQDPISEIKARLDIVDVVGRKVALKKSGHTFKGLCPFHTEKTPSFIVFPDKGNYHCFGCGANGDVFGFVMKTENVDFPEALRQLAAQAGVELKSKTSNEGSDRRRSQLTEVIEQATLFFQQSLHRPGGQAARQYLADRGLSSETIDRFRLGWAPESWDGLFKYLTDKGIQAELIIAAGLAGERETGGYYDRFRNRVVFPIFSERGEPVGFGGRTLGDQQPKYLNSPETELFDKGATLYGIDQAKAAIRAGQRVIIVEGYVDVLIAHQNGVREVVASLGTALTDRQVGILKKLTRTVVLALDSDAAGDEAILRGLEVARQVYSDATVAVPLPQGLVRLENRLGADILIAALPRGRDPDEIIREDIESWHRVIDNAQPVVDFYFDLVLGRADLTSSKGVSAAVHQLLPIIGDVRDPMQQAVYLRRLSDRVQIAEQLLMSELARMRLAAKPRGDRIASEEPRQPRRRSTLDEYVIGLILLYPAQARPFLDEVSEADLELVESQEVYREIWRQVENAGQPDRSALGTVLTEPISEWLNAVLEREGSRPPLDQQAVRNEQGRCLRDLRRRQRRARLQEMAMHLRDLEAAGDDTATADLHRRAEHELTQLEADERLSRLAFHWSRTLPLADDGR